MRVGVLVSGRGSNLQALLAAQDRGDLAPAELAVVVSNRPGAEALEHAAAAGVATAVIDHTGYDDRETFDRALVAELRAHGVEALVLAGFMRVLTPVLLGAFPHRIINVHPSLLPAFPGLRAPEQAIEHGVKVSGCTVHFVEAGVDSGPIIAQRAVEVRPDDTAVTLHGRIQVIEHELLPQATAWLAAGRLEVVGRTVRIH